MHSGPPPLPQWLSHSLRSIRFPFLCVPDAQDSGAVTQSFWDKVRCVGLRVFLPRLTTVHFDSSERGPPPGVLLLPPQRPPSHFRPMKFTSWLWHPPRIDQKYFAVLLSWRRGRGSQREIPGGYLRACPPPFGGKDSGIRFCQQPVDPDPVPVLGL